MNTHGAVGVQLNAFLTSALDGSVWSASHPNCFTPRGKGPWYPFNRGWVSSKAGMDADVRRKLPSLAGNGTPVV